MIATLSKSEKKSKKGKTTTKLFVPYRDSLLTKLLKNTLGGNSKTILLLCGSPHQYNINETISTLEFGSRAKSIRNRPIQNIELSVDDLRSNISKSMEILNHQNLNIRR